MKKYSKLFALLLALLMVLSLFTACGDKKDDDDDEKKEKTSETAEDNENSTTEEETTTKVGNKIEIITMDSEQEESANSTAATTRRAAETTRRAETTRKPETTRREETTAPPANTAKDVLVGDWETEFVIEGLSFFVVFNFRNDGTVKTSYPRSNYDQMINQVVSMTLADVSDEEIAAEGFTSREEAEEYIKEMLIEEIPYADIANEFDISGTWNLNGDTLTITLEGESETAETKLSEGKTTFTVIDEDGETLNFRKIR